MRGGPWWLAGVAGWLGLSSLSLAPDPTRIVAQAESFALRAIDVTGRRHPIALYDGRGWVVETPRVVPGPPAATPQAIVGLETSEGVPMRTVRVFAASGPDWQWAQAAVEAVAVRAARVGERRQTEVSMYVPAVPGAQPVYADLTVRTPDPQWRGAVVGAWVLPVAGTSPIVLGARVTPFRSYDEFIRIPRRHPLGIAVAGRGGVQTWVMYNRGPGGDAFELAAVSRRGLRELPAIPRGPS